MKKKIFISIIIPAYNEEKNFEKGALVKIARYLKNFSYPYEVVLVDDGSDDKTASLIKDFIKNKKDWRLIKNPHQGKAAAVARGVKMAEGENILFTDFDQATPLAEVEKLLPFLKKGYDIIIGSREVEGAKREKEPFYRHLMGKVFNLIVQIFALPGIHDTQCGFKLFRAPVAKKLFLQLQIYKPEIIRTAFTGAFDVELLYLAQKRGFKIAEVPVFWQHYPTNRINPVRDSMRMFFDVLKIRLYDWLGKYE
jgi:dolichyl-phosphate beta-glucosyltransferase